MKEFKSVDIEQSFRKLSATEKDDLKNYLDYRRSRGLNADTKLQDVRSGIIRLSACSGKPLSKLSIQEVIEIVSLIKSSKYGDYSKIEAITNLKRYVKWKNPSMNLEDIRLIKSPVRKREINPDDLLTKEDIEKLIRHEPKMFWKAFLITQFEAGLRTKEVRYLKWSDIDFNTDEDISEISIFATKTKKQRSIAIKEATFYLKKLKDEQTNLEQKGLYVFHCKKDVNKPIDRSQISHWMTRLSKRALGHHKWNYLLRHSRGNELYQLSKQNKVSKDIALAFMGHSKEMSSVYTHDNSKEIKKMLKDQIYHIEDLPPEQKNELSKMKKEFEEFKKEMQERFDANKEFFGSLDKKEVDISDYDVITRGNERYYTKDNKLFIIKDGKMKAVPITDKLKILIK